MGGAGGCIKVGGLLGRAMLPVIGDGGLLHV